MTAHAHTHPHTPAVHADGERRLFWAMLLTGGFLFVEVAGGLLSGSLALLADAGHMLADVASLALAWFGFRVSRRPADRNRSYGYHRFEVLIAFANGVLLFAIVFSIFSAAVHRFWEPVPVQGSIMIAVAAVGLLVNIGSLWLLHDGDRDNLNLRGAMVHVVGDLLGSVAAVAAALVILWTGWTPIDPLLSLVVGLLIAHSAWSIVSDSAHILLEGTPTHIDVDRLTSELCAAVSAIQDIHHVHLWSLTPQRVLLTLHLTVTGDSDQDVVLEDVKKFLEHRWGICHSTVQVERRSCPEASACSGMGRCGEIRH